MYANDGNKQNRELKPLQTLGKLERLLMDGKITEEEYRERKATYVELILEMYCLGILDREQLYKKINGYTEGE
jgi:hypothetical protein